MDNPVITCKPQEHAVILRTPHAIIWEGGGFRPFGGSKNFWKSKNPHLEPIIWWHFPKEEERKKERKKRREKCAFFEKSEFAPNMHKYMRTCAIYISPFQSLSTKKGSRQDTGQGGGWGIGMEEKKELFYKTNEGPPCAKQCKLETGSARAHQGPPRRLHHTFCRSSWQPSGAVVSRVCPSQTTGQGSRHWMCISDAFVSVWVYSIFWGAEWHCSRRSIFELNLAKYSIR
jgi:hypothetical protein